MAIGLYVHIPFCKSKCFYCSFASYEDKSHLIESYFEALHREAFGYKGALVDTVYIGGGTPSFLSNEQIQALFLLIYQNFIIPKGVEMTFEANPATFDSSKLEVLRQNGVTRFSLGVQSLNDVSLEYLGRPHSSMEAYAAFDLARRAGFENINVDLIYSLPGQTDDDIRDDVNRLASMGSEHVSLYGLTVSEGCELFARRDAMPVEERQAQQYLLVESLLEKKKLAHYEISNFAKKGLECRHNLNYWRSGDYLGLGSGAHSHFQGHRFWNLREPEKYIRRVLDTGTGQEGEEWLEIETQLIEAFLIGLRITDGVSISELESRFDSELSAEKKRLVEEFVENGLLVHKDGRLRTTSEGRLVLDELCARLV
jgi:oxygen-independent coproporphyrinogen-3 oxidase